MHAYKIFYLIESTTKSIEVFGKNFANMENILSTVEDVFSIQSIISPTEIIEKLTKGELKSRDTAILLSLKFGSNRPRVSQLVDPPHEEDSHFGLSILRTIKRIDPDFPVVVLVDKDDEETVFRLSGYGADDYFLIQDLQIDENALHRLMLRIKKSVVSNNKKCTYDHDHLDTADGFAKDYDAVEKSKFATVSYYVFENELICKAVDDVMANKDTPRIRILDIGCGTGRIEEYLIHHTYSNKFDIVAIDFSGKMLSEAHAKLISYKSKCNVVFGKCFDDTKIDKARIALYRSPAENLKFLTHRFSDGFDVIILGFGLLSYVKYTDVIKASPETSPDSGIFPHLKKGGRLLFSVYNEESAIYARVANLETPDVELSIAALMDLSAGLLKVGNRRFNCEAFRKDRIIRFIRQAGFSIDPENITTFPTLNLIVNNSDIFNYPDYSDSLHGKYSHLLYDLDKQVSQTIPNRGHYIVGVATKNK